MEFALFIFSKIADWSDCFVDLRKDLFRHPELVEGSMITLRQAQGDTIVKIKLIKL